MVMYSLHSISSIFIQRIRTEQTKINVIFFTEAEKQKVIMNYVVCGFYIVINYLVMGNQEKL